MDHVKQGMTLEEWEATNALTDFQKAGAESLQNACAELPLPETFLGENSSHSTPLARSSRSPDFLKGHATPKLGYSAIGDGAFRIRSALANQVQDGDPTQGEQTLGLEKPVQTMQEFLDWFSGTEKAIEQEQNDTYRAHLHMLLTHRDVCDEILKEVSEAVQLLSGMKSNYDFVEDRTRALQTACEELIVEQERLQHLSEELTKRLYYFNQLEPIARQFNNPGENICMQENFLPNLDILDRCIQFLDKHPQYHDTELYAMRYRQCLTRGVTLIKMHFVSKFRQITHDAHKKLDAAKSSSRGSGQRGLQTLLYVNFRVAAEPLRLLVAQLEQRCEGYKEYTGLLRECHSCYFLNRQQILNPIISAKITELGPYGDDLIAFARDACSYMTDLCHDEFDLFFQFFNSGEAELYEFLETLVSYLYDYLRPRIIHENKSEILSELCEVLKMNVLRDAGVQVEGKRVISFGFLVRNMIEDTQQRLVFRCEQYINNEIRNFIPTPKDLDYPARLSDTPETSEKIGNGSAAPAINHGSNTIGWFPSLSRTLWILPKMYGNVQTSVFQDLGQEAVSACRDSLLNASIQIADKVSKMDGEVFLIKHLLLLKEQIAPYEADFVHSGKELDFSQIIDAFSNLTTSSVLRPNAFLGLAYQGFPKIVDVSVDSRREVDKELKAACESFIQSCQHSATESISAFMLKVSALQLRNQVKAPDQKLKLSSQSFAEPESIMGTIATFKKRSQDTLHTAVIMLQKYLQYRNSELVITKNIQTRILDTYKPFYVLVNAECDLSTLPEPLPSIEDIGAWLADIFTNEIVTTDEASNSQ